MVAVLEAASFSLANGGIQVPVDLKPHLAGGLIGRGLEAPEMDSSLLGSLSTASVG